MILERIAREFIITLIRHQVKKTSEISGRTIEVENIKSTYERLLGLTPDSQSIEGSYFRSLISEVFSRETQEDRENYTLFKERLEVLKDFIEHKDSERDLYKDVRANILTNASGAGILDKQIEALESQVSEKLLSIKALVHTAGLTLGQQVGDLTNPLVDTFLALLSVEADTILTRKRKLEIRRRSIRVSSHLRKVGKYAKTGILDQEKKLDVSLSDLIDDLIKLCSNDGYRRSKVNTLETSGEIVGVRNTLQLMRNA